jgi:hypothetical protein
MRLLTRFVSAIFITLASVFLTIGFFFVWANDKINEE